MPAAAELDELFESLRAGIGTALVRDARYLHWRFVESPTDDYRFIAARRRGRLTGYLVFTIAGELLLVKDWLGADARAVRTLFGAAIDEACAADVASALRSARFPTWRGPWPFSMAATRCGALDSSNG